MQDFDIESIEKIMPLFINHESARYWFKQRFGELFVMVDSMIENSIKFYVYHLVKDKIAYVQSMNAIRENSPFIHNEFKDSYEEILISEQGVVIFD